MRDTVLFFRDFIDAINQVEDAEAYTRIMKAVTQYAFYDEQPQLTGMEKALFTVAQIKIDVSIKSYEETIKKRSEAGKKGMESRWHNKVITNDNNVTEAITKITINKNKNKNKNKSKYNSGSYDYESLERELCE